MYVRCQGEKYAHFLIFGDFTGSVGRVGYSTLVLEKRKKITIKIPETLFSLMERKRAKDGTSFQEVGLACFRSWVYQGENNMRDATREREDCEEILTFLNEAPLYLTAAIRGIISGWSEKKGQNGGQAKGNGNNTEV